MSQDKTGLYLDWLDYHMNPGQNFYEFANGTWRKNHPIPAAYPSWSVWTVLQENNTKIIHTLIQNIAKNPNNKPNSIQQKIGDFYKSGMDETALNKLGSTPLQPEFSRIENMNQLSDLQHEIAHLQLIGMSTPFIFDQMQDFTDSSKVIGIANQGGLGLPDRDYYLLNDKKFVELRKDYLSHVTRMLKLLGETPFNASQDAHTILTIETAFAKASLSRIEQRDPHHIYHLKTLDELQKVTPHFDWKLFFADLGYPDIQQINLATPTFFVCIEDQLKNLSLKDWKVYLRWHLIQATAPYLSKPFVDESFYLQKKLTGAKQLLPRWHRVMNEENEALGFAVGKLYVEKMFPLSSKQAIQDILDHIRNTLELDLKTVPWMSSETRTAALHKLSLMKYHIGYPDKWRDYSALSIDQGPYVLNILKSAEFAKRYSLNKIGKPVDRQEWDMIPQEINAYYDPSKNEFNLLAGILQPPFFNPNAGAAVNYGAIGYVIGHEMTHAFDDQGAQFDGQGNLKNWWTEDDLKKFQLAAHCIVHQYSQYKINGQSVQGNLVSGEAIADLSGMTLAYNAFHESSNYSKAVAIKGFTPDQQFFLSAAHINAANMRPEESRRRILIDPHPPIQLRSNGIFANMPEFQNSFALSSNSPMINKDRCKVW